MKAKELKETLEVMGTLKQNTSLPTLHNVLITSNAEYSMLTFQHTDLETSIQRSFNTSGLSGINHLVNLKALKKFVSKLDKDETIHFKGDESDKLVVSSLCKGKYVSQKFKSFDPETFPTFPDISADFGWEFSDESDIFNKLIETSKFTAKDDYRPALNGIFFDSENNRIVATDGHRLVTFNNVANEFPVSFVLPNIVSTLKKLKKNKIINLHINEEKTHIFFSVYPEDRIRITCKLNEDAQEFPPVDRIIPTEDKLKFKFQIETGVFEVAKNLNIGGWAHTEILHFIRGESGTQHILEITSEDSDNNVSEVKDTYGDIGEITLTEEFKAAYNADFLFEVAKFAGELVVLSFQEEYTTGQPSRTTCITITSDKNPNRLALLMPVKMDR